MRKMRKLEDVNYVVFNKNNVLNTTFNTFISSLGLLNPKISYIEQIIWAENNPSKLAILEYGLQYEMQKMHLEYLKIFNIFPGLVDLKKKLNRGRGVMMLETDGSILKQFNIDPSVDKNKYHIFCDVLNDVTKYMISRGMDNLYTDNSLLSVVDIGCSYNLIFADSQYTISKDKVEEFTISSLRRWLKSHLPERRLEKMRLKALKEAFNYFF